MLYKIKTIFKICYRFPFSYALVLSFKFLFKKFKKVKLPNLDNPIYLRENTSDFDVFEQVYLNNDYNISWNKNVTTIIDAGANVGFFSLKIKSEVPEAQIICIEPETDNFEMLCKNLQGYKNVFFEKCGIWSSETKLKISNKFNGGMWSMVVEEDSITGNIDAIGIDYLMSKYNLTNIDILKLDIESSEKELFSKNYENWLPKVKLIIIEFHDGWVEGCSKSFFKAINRTFDSYSISCRGESIIVKNNDLD